MRVRYGIYIHLFYLPDKVFREMLRQIIKVIKLAINTKM